MFDRIIDLMDSDSVFIYDGNEKEGVGCGRVNNDGHLYLIRLNEHKAYQLPDCYKDTPIILYHPCGGFQEGLIMVSLLGELNLRYHETFGDTAGMWGWLNEQGDIVIPPQYIFAMSFCNGHAIVCKGTWQVTKNGRYWADDEQWGVIDHSGNEVVPCRYDEIFEIDGSDSLFLCHKGGWEENGKQCIFDSSTGTELMDLDFTFDDGYMFNECLFTGTHIVFIEHNPGEEEDFIYAYSIERKEWDAVKEKLPPRTLNEKTKIVVNKDGQDIIIF